MEHPNSKKNNQPILTEDGSHTVISNIFGETYHSTHGAITESKHVFIQEGIDYFLENNDKNKIKIFEMGMGTGLNLLLSYLKTDLNLTIEYTTTELYPLTALQISKLNYKDILLELDNHSIFNQIHQSEWNENITLSEYFTFLKLKTDITVINLEQKFDIIYFDAFGPRTQPNLWSKNILQKMYDALLPTGVFVTYSAMGQLKRDLKSIGFELQSIPGPPGKREMTRAVKNT